MTMTGSAATSVIYEPDGLQTRFPVPFPLFDAGDVHAVSVAGTAQTELANFVVEGLGTGEGAHVRFFSPPSFGPKLVLYRWTKRVQESEYPEGGRFPAKTLEADLDRLVAMAQEVDDQFGRTLKVPHGAGVTPGEYTASFFLAAEAAGAAADRAAASASASGEAAQTARNMAKDAAAQAGNAVLMAESASHSAREAAGIVNRGMADATETAKGVVRLATAAEHESGEPGLAATPAQVKALADALMGKMAGIKKELEEEIGKKSRAPLLSLVWSTTGLAKEDHLILSVDHGTPRRDAWTEVFAEIQAAYDANTGAVVDDAAWLSMLQTYGECPKYSLGDGAATFRFPLLCRRSSVSPPDPTVNAAHGDFVRDQFQGHGHFPANARAVAASGSAPANPGGNLVGSQYAETAGTAAKGHGAPRVGDITHGPLIVYTPMLRVR